MASPSTPGTPYNLTCLTCADPIMALRHVENILHKQ